MENKYYTPKIEDIYSGFEYEYLERNGNWKKSDEFSNEYDYEDNPHYAILKDIDEGKIRVKYLDREDIESEGWKKGLELFDYGDVDELRDGYSITMSRNKTFVLFIQLDFKILIIDKTYTSEISQEWKTIFDGTLKNLSEFRKLQQQLGIK